VIFLGLIIGLIPLIVYSRFVEYEPEIISLHSRPNSINFFSYVRALWLYTLTGSATIWFWAKGKIAKHWAYVPIVAYLFFAVVSTIFSYYPSIAFWGTVEQQEGLITKICYMGIVFLLINLVNDIKKVKFLLAFLLLCSGLISLIGLFQFLGYDYFFDGFADKYLVSDQIRSIAPDFNVSSMSPKPDAIFLTFGNSNYTGSYMALLFSLTLGLIIGLKRFYSFSLVPLNLLLFFNLVGSKSRAGMIGALVATIFGLHFFRIRLKGKFKLLLFLTAIYLIIVFSMDNYYRDQGKKFIDSSFNRSAIAKKALFGNFEELILNKDEANVVFDGLMLKIRYKNEKVHFYDSNDKKLPYKLIKKSDVKSEINSRKIPGKINSFARSLETINKPGLDSKARSYKENDSLDLEKKFLVLFPEEEMRGYIIFVWPEKRLLNIGRGGESFFLYFTGKEFRILDQAGRAVKIKKVSSYGFKGYESIGSGRGYIWSRTLPLIKNSIFMGYGPDTFFLTFPNNDFIGKLRHLSKGIYRLVDKPHNLYLQIAIDTGLLSLISILFLLGAYFIQTQKCLFRSDLTNLEEVVGQSIILAVLAYLVAGFFNDSVNSVAPVFWGLVGLGIAINRIVEKKNGEPAKELDN
jgi:hypothetical protein